MEALVNNFKKDLLALNQKNDDLTTELITEKNEQIYDLNKTIEENIILIDNLNKQVDDLKSECKNYENVSIHKNLAKQISEKDNEIRILNNRLSSLENKYNLLNKKI